MPSRARRRSSAPSLLLPSVELVVRTCASASPSASSHSDLCFTQISFRVAHDLAEGTKEGNDGAREHRWPHVLRRQPALHRVHALGQCSASHIYLSYLISELLLASELFSFRPSHDFDSHSVSALSRVVDEPGEEPWKAGLRKLCAKRARLRRIRRAARGAPSRRIIGCPCPHTRVMRTACCAGGGSQARGQGCREARPPGREQSGMEQQYLKRKHAAVPRSTEDAAAFKGACADSQCVLQAPTDLRGCVRGSSIRSSEQTTTFVVSSSTGRISASTCRGPTRMSSMRDMTAARTD